MATGDWLPEADVLAYLKVDAASDNAPAVRAARSAAVRYVERQRADLALDALPVPLPAADQAALGDLILGTLLLVGRLYARKGTPEGIASFGELGAAMILRADPDISMLLGIGRHGRPGVA